MQLIRHQASVQSSTILILVAGFAQKYFNTEQNDPEPTKKLSVSKKKYGFQVSLACWVFRALIRSVLVPGPLFLNSKQSF